MVFVHWLFEIVWFCLPFYVANAAPLWMRNAPLLSCPVDLGYTLGSTRILGDHKTLRGVVFGILFGILTAFIQGRSAEEGFVLGVGAMIGDLLGSFFKRRMGIPSGAPHILFDQVLYSVCALALAAYFSMLTLSAIQAVSAILIFTILHRVGNVMNHWLGIKDVAW